MQLKARKIGLLIAIIAGFSLVSCQTGMAEDEVRAVINKEVDIAVATAIAGVEQGPPGPVGPRGVQGTPGGVDLATRRCIDTLVAAIERLSGHTHQISSFALDHTHDFRVSQYSSYGTTDRDGPSFGVTTDRAPTAFLNC